MKVKDASLKNEVGITLVALIVTIIVLLILAGISIANLTGNGLLEKTKKAKEEHEIQSAQETLNTKLMSIIADNNGKKELNNLDGLTIDGYNTKVSNAGKIITMTKNNKSYYFLVDSEYNIENLNKISGTTGESNSGSGSQNNADKNFNSQIINDFEIEISFRKSKSLTVNAKTEITTKNGSKKRTYSKKR